MSQFSVYFHEIFFYSESCHFNEKDPSEASTGWESSFEPAINEVS